MNLVRLLVIAVVMTAALGFVGYHILSFFFSIQVSRQKLASDMDDMRLRLKEDKLELVPLNDEALDSLSFHSAENVLIDKISKSKEGVFTSIFHEPILAYAYKKYKGRSDRAIMLLETKDDSYEYVISDGVTKIAKNSNPFAIVHNDGKMYNTEQELMASVEISDNSYLPIVIDEQPKAMLHNPYKNSNSLSRAFEMVDGKNEEEEESILLLSTLMVIQSEA